MSIKEVRRLCRLQVKYYQTMVNLSAQKVVKIHYHNLLDYWQARLNKLEEVS